MKKTAELTEEEKFEVALQAEQDERRLQRTVSFESIKCLYPTSRNYFAIVLALLITLM